MKAKGPAAAKVEEEKKKGLALFGPKPPTPKLLRAFGGTINKNFIDRVKVTHARFRHRVVVGCNCTGSPLNLGLFLSSVCFWRPVRNQGVYSQCLTPFLESVYSFILSLLSLLCTSHVCADSSPNNVCLFGLKVTHGHVGCNHQKTQ